MKPRDYIVIALLTVLVIVVIVQGKRKAPADTMVGKRKERMVRGPGPTDVWAQTYGAPYTSIQNAIGRVRGNPEAKNILLQGRPAFQAFNRSSGDLRPEDLMAAERAAWALAAEQDRVAPYDIEKMTNPSEDTMQHFETAPALDYQAMITDLVVDPRTRMNHSQWVNEMRGWTGQRK